MNRTTVLVIYLSSCSGFVMAQGAWTQKSNMPGSGTHEMGAFTISGKGYIVGGAIAYPNWTNQTWEFDPAGAGSWTQKANVPATGLREPVAFAIGNKGYAGTGMTGTSLVKNFYEFDPVANTWTAKANFGGTARRDAVGFSIGTKGYIGTGADAASSTNDFWEYDPAGNTWTQKLAFGGVIRNASTGFTIGSKGYVTTGRMSSTTYNDLWEYDPAGNTWTQKANYSGVTRSECAVFVIGTIAYVGLGHTGGATDFWSYNAVANAWSAVANFPGTGAERFESVGFSIGNKGYVCGGIILGTGAQIDTWEFDPAATSVGEENSNDEFTIYPNPASERISVSCKDKKNNLVSVALHDLKGNQILISSRVENVCGKENITLEVSKLPAGTYLLVASSSSGIRSRKIQVVR